MTPHPPKALIWVTVFMIAAIAILSPIFYNKELPNSLTINTHGQPTIGYREAKVHVVVFEEPKCFVCKQYSNEIFPKIKQEFIDTNKIRYTLIPVSFLPNSLPAANALLSVYYTDNRFPDSELYFTFFDYMYQHQPPEDKNWATFPNLLAMARAASPAIRMQKLEYDLLKQTYRIQIEKNTLYAQKIMGGRVMTPTVYVNGIKINYLSYDALKDLIEELLQRNGGD